MGLAERSGIDGASVRAFIQVQIDVAKAVQYRFRADWLSAPEPHWHTRTLEVVRKEISSLNVNMMPLLSEVVSNARLDMTAFTGSISAPHVTAGDAEKIVAAIRRIHKRHSG